MLLQQEPLPLNPTLSHGFARAVEFFTTPILHGEKSNEASADLW